MDKINDGGPAFPIPDPFNLKPETEDDMMRFAAGISMRDYFAAKAMQAQLTAFWAMETHHVWSNGEIAREAYAIADAMLKARQA